MRKIETKCVRKKIRKEKVDREKEGKRGEERVGYLHVETPVGCTGLGSFFPLSVIFLLLLPYLTRPGNVRHRHANTVKPGSSPTWQAWRNRV